MRPRRRSRGPSEYPRGAPAAGPRPRPRRRHPRRYLDDDFATGALGAGDEGDEGLDEGEEGLDEEDDLASEYEDEDSGSDGFAPFEYERRRLKIHLGRCETRRG